jgi:hypothetical protein
MYSRTVMENGKMVVKSKMIKGIFGVRDLGVVIVMKVIPSIQIVRVVYIKRDIFRLVMLILEDA